MNKAEIKVVYYIGMYTGQRLKDCALMQWRNIDLEQKRIWVKQFKTGKEVLIPIAEPLLAVLQEARKWQTDTYACPKVAARYLIVDEKGKEIGDSLVNIVEVTTSSDDPSYFLPVSMDFIRYTAQE